MVPLVPCFGRTCHYYDDQVNERDGNQYCPTPLMASPWPIPHTAEPTQVEHVEIKMLKRKIRFQLCGFLSAAVWSIMKLQIFNRKLILAEFYSLQDESRCNSYPMSISCIHQNANLTRSEYIFGRYPAAQLGTVKTGNSKVIVVIAQISGYARTSVVAV